MYYVNENIAKKALVILHGRSFGVYVISFENHFRMTSYKPKDNALLGEYNKDEG